MLFTELRFLLFFAIVFGGHWLLPGGRARKIWLLAASYLFYAGWDGRFLGLILLSTAVDYFAGRRLVEVSPFGGRRFWLVSSLVVNLGVLGLFKYYDFFLGSAIELLTSLGFSASPRALQWILPVGISFYTFQTLSYTIDVYRGRLDAERSVLDFALFVAFFPQLVAGPIVRAAEFLPQLKASRRLSEVALRPALTLFLVGYFKKACVADNLARAVDPVFADSGAYDAASLWLANALYGIQIYCDFSGYSDMAIAVGALLGYRLPLNFDAPYLASTVTDFWRRWHISLSSWFRDYFYIPLGGNRVSAARNYANLGVTFLLCGLWHGASWNFVVWGALHGLYLVAERVSNRRSSAWNALGWLRTQLLVMLAWVPFRAADLDATGRFFDRMFSWSGDVDRALQLDPALGWIALGLLASHALERRARLTKRFGRLRPPLFSLAYGAVCALVLPFAAGDYQPFIYFQF